MLQIFKTVQDLSRQAAKIFLQTALEAVKNNGRFNVALTGGNSPVELYKILAQTPYNEAMPWANTYVFWGDERWVPLTDKDSNAKMAYETLLNHVPVPTDQIFAIWSETKPEEYAKQYEDFLIKHFEGTPRFDLILLGMGDDGHTASLFPHTEVLKEQEKLVDAYYLAPQSMYRITLTAPCINAAKKILFITYGEKKAHALHEVIEGVYNPGTYPSQLIKPADGEVIWLVDKAASQLLEQTTKIIVS